MFNPTRTFLLLSLQRALLGNVHQQLRQASIEARIPHRLLRLRFEYEAGNFEQAQDSCSAAVAEVISDLPPDWDVEEEHLPAPNTQPLNPLAFVGYRRAEP